MYFPTALYIDYGYKVGGFRSSPSRFIEANNPSTSQHGLVSVRSICMFRFTLFDTVTDVRPMYRMHRSSSQGVQPYQSYSERMDTTANPHSLANVHQARESYLCPPVFLRDAGLLRDISSCPTYILNGRHHRLLCHLWCNCKVLQASLQLSSLFFKDHVPVLVPQKQMHPRFPCHVAQ